MSVSQSSSSSEDQSILASLRLISSMLSTRRRLQCTLTMFLTVAQASLLRFFVAWSKVDQFLSHDPAEVTCDNLFTPYSLKATFFTFFELYELCFILVKVHKVQAKNEVHKV